MGSACARSTRASVLLCPVSELVENKPYMRIDPKALEAKGITFDLAATHQGYMLHANERIEFDDVPELDFAICGSVAVTPLRRPHRQGQRLRRSRNRHLSRPRQDWAEHSPMATTVHSMQLVEDEVIGARAATKPARISVSPAERADRLLAPRAPHGVHWGSAVPA